MTGSQLNVSLFSVKHHLSLSRIEGPVQDRRLAAQKVILQPWPDDEHLNYGCPRFQVLGLREGHVIINEKKEPARCSRHFLCYIGCFMRVTSCVARRLCF